MPGVRTQGVPIRSRGASARPARRSCRRSIILLLAACCAVAPGHSAAGAPPEAKPPNDPLFRHQWNLRAIQIPAAWSISRGAGATVAVLDTGVAYADRGRYRRAPDLAGTRFVPGWDFVDDDPFPHDVPPSDGRRSHGTQIAAIIAQTANNGLGAAGVAPRAAIMPIRVLKPDLNGTGADIARGLRFAADHGADVANLSISGPTPSRPLTRAIAYATARGVTVVAASGNGGTGVVGWPAADPRVLAVGAVARDRTRAPYSSFGKPVDLVAPAGAGDLLDSGYGPGDGVAAQTLKGGPARFCFCFMASTSAAAAHVSGVAALVAAVPEAGIRARIRPAARVGAAARIRRALLSSARDLGRPGRDPEHGAGLVQAYDALSGIGASPASADTAQNGPFRGVRLPLAVGGAMLVVLAGVLMLTRRIRAA